jgi:hypothetical protein
MAKSETDLVEKIAIIIAFLFFLIGLAVLNVGVLNPITTLMAISMIIVIMTQIVVISILYKIEKNLRKK